MCTGAHHILCVVERVISTPSVWALKKLRRLYAHWLLYVCFDNTVPIRGDFRLGSAELVDSRENGFRIEIG